LADYRDHYAAISATGASLAALSVDTPAESEELRNQLSLPFVLLSDVERHIIREWGLLNAKERGGIAKPSVFVIDANLRVLYAVVDTVAARVPAAQILSVLQPGRDSTQIRRKIYIPLPRDWIRALRNNSRKR